ncbi:MAG: ABC transporter ATP-binding protein [Alteripontixanthobacter sp.]
MIPNLRNLYAVLPSERRRQLFWLLWLMVLAGLAELATIGLLLPFLALVAGSKTLSGPSREVIEAALHLLPSGFDEVLAFTTAFIAIVLVAGALRFALSFQSQKIAHEVGHDLGVAVFTGAMGQPFEMHAQNNSNFALAGIDKTHEVTNKVLLPLIQAVSGLVLCCAIAAALLFLEPAITGTAFAVLVMTYWIVSRFNRKRLSVNSGSLAANRTRRVRTVREALEGIRHVTLDKAHDEFLARYKKADRAFKKAQLENAVMAFAPRYAVQAGLTIAIAIIALTISRSEGGLMGALPLLGIFALAGQRLLPALHQVYHGISTARGYNQSLADVLYWAGRWSEGRGRTPLAEALPFERSIALIGVDYNYRTSNVPVLTNLDLTIAKNEHIGLIGPTGSGKTTATDLIMGLLAPTSGRIMIDDHELTPANAAVWQRGIAHVAQNVFLLDASLTQNIAFGEPPEAIDHERVRQAARIAAIDEFIEQQQYGYDTIAGERGARLSGGQAQRIGIARAIYRRASLLVLDEPTSALDDAVEQSIVRSLHDNGRHLTIIIIAQRMSSVVHCDRIVRLDGGKLEEIGIDEFRKTHL